MLAAVNGCAHHPRCDHRSYLAPSRGSGWLRASLGLDRACGRTLRVGDGRRDVSDEGSELGMEAHTKLTCYELCFCTALSLARPQEATKRTRATNP